MNPELQLQPPPPSPSDPPGALFLVLGYLRLRELLSFQRVCRSLRDAVAGDPLLWRRISVDRPLGARLHDEALLRMASRSGGMLASLALLDCPRITDGALLRIARDNPGLTQLYVPGCTSLTVDGVVRVVRWLAEHKGNLERLQIYGVRNIRREHLDILNSFLQKTDEQRVPQPFFYGSWQSLPYDGEGRPIDVDVCPKCRNIALVFDCTREDCRTMKNRWTECKGCFFCIARCEDCGACINYEEVGEETACSHLLCLDCWLQLPKCNMCNRPYCNRHGQERFATTAGSSIGFICEECVLIP
ncbi:F-box protein SKIP28 [Iris pallida]|uniref:F-box protein SKIP28 n=1 Tax=Iris pallida TaxID=29817 RepID=A0AAX6FVS6_IRIPA|nr:F-box protein SKIP28 [Iris pallida]